MYETILCPTDGSDNAQLAARRAIDLAVDYGAAFHALSVVERSRDDPELTGLGEHTGEQLAEFRTLLEELERRATDEGVETTTSIERGVARTAIETYASDHDVDLIVIGSRGASDTAEKMLGTVSKYVVNEAPADVLVVRRDERLE